MQRRKIMLNILKEFDFKSIFIAFMILLKRKLKIQNFSKKHLICFKHKQKKLKFWVRENDGLLAILDTFCLKIYDHEICKNNKIILDCGAHIGTSAVFFQLLNPKSKIYCFEPDKSSFELLKDNLKLNEINSRVYNYAISNKKGAIKFQSNLNCSVGSRVGEQGQDVQSRDLDSLMKEIKINKIDLLKLDIEGEELKVLKKLSHPEKIKNFTCEVHSQYYPPSELKQLIEKKGFKIYPDAEKEKFNSLFSSRF